MTENTVLHLALAQAPADLGNVADRLDWLATILPNVAVAKADLLLLPELFACGYSIGAAIRDRAEPRDGPIAKAIGGLAQEHGVAIHYGYAEAAHGTIYNAAQAFGPDGQTLVHQRKLAIPPGFEREFFAPGKGCALFELNGIRIATLICYDAEFPETVRHVARMGAEVVLVPTALGAAWDWVARTMIPTRAYENGVYLAYANSAGREGDMDFLGASVIAAPDGVKLARAAATPEILVATLTKDRVRAAQSRLPYVNEYRDLPLGPSD